MLKLKLQYLGHLMQRVDSLEKTLMLGGIGSGGEGDDRGWDGWMASPIRWTRVWVNSGSWWWTGRPGVLRFMGLRRVRHDWATELNWTECLFLIHCSIVFSWFNNIPIDLSIILLTDIWFVFTLRLLRITLLWTFLYTFITCIFLGCMPGSRLFLVDNAKQFTIVLLSIKLMYDSQVVPQQDSSDPVS